MRTHSISEHILYEITFYITVAISSSSHPRQKGIGPTYIRTHSMRTHSISKHIICGVGISSSSPPHQKGILVDPAQVVKGVDANQHNSNGCRMPQRRNAPRACLVFFRTCWRLLKTREGRNYTASSKPHTHMSHHHTHMSHHHTHMSHHHTHMSHHHTHMSSKQHTMSVTFVLLEGSDIYKDLPLFKYLNRLRCT